MAGKPFADAALTVEEEESILSANPFLVAIMERSLDYYSKTEKESAEAGEGQKDSPSRLILP